MMMHLSRQTVRQGWPPYVGSAVAVSLGVVLISLTVTVLQAVDATASRLRADREVRTALDDLASMFGIMSAVSMFMALFVVGSTFGFVVAARRRELGLLRLVGATPRQVRRLVLGESLVVAVGASAAGALLAAIAAPAVLWILHARGVTPVLLDTPSPWLAASIAVPAGVVVALLGSWRSSRRAARVVPMAALLESSVEKRGVTIMQAAVGTVCVGGAAAGVVVSSQLDPLFALVASVLLPEVLVIGLMCFGGLVFPALAGLLARPFAGRDVTARLARDQVRSGVRTTASMAAPVLAISAIAGSMILTLSFTADWTTGMDRASLEAPLVVETGGSPGVLDEIAASPDVDLVDERLVAVPRVGSEREPTPVEGIDPVAAGAARSLVATEGSLQGLAADGAAISQTYVVDAGVHLGDRLTVAFAHETVRLTVRAIVQDAPDLHEDVMVSRELLLEHAPRTLPDLAFVTLRPGVDPATAAADLRRLVATSSDDGASVLTASAWIDQVDHDTRAMNDLGLWVLLGPSGLYAGIAVVNTILIGALQRRRELDVLGLVGATREQLRRMALWEAGLVGGAALLAGGAVSGGLGWMVRNAMAHDLDHAALTIPWLPLGAIAATGMGLVLLAALAGSAATATRKI